VGKGREERKEREKRGKGWQRRKKGGEKERKER